MSSQCDDVAQGHLLSLKVEALCRAIAPDLAGKPLYVLPFSALPASWHDASYLGCTGSRYDLHHRDIIGERWQGRGPCIAVNDIGIRQRVPADMVESWFSTIAIHELGHCLTENWTYRSEAAPVDADESKAAVKWVQHQPTIEENREAIQVFHRDDWIRSVLHLRHRALQWESDLPASVLLMNSLPYFTACLWIEALGDEPERLSAMTIREILNEPVPDAFRELWTDAMLRFKSASQNLEGDDSMSGILERIGGIFQKRQQTRAEAFEALVLDIADGKKVDPATAAEIVANVNKTPGELESEVNRLTERRACREGNRRCEGRGRRTRRTGNQGRGTRSHLHAQPRKTQRRACGKKRPVDHPRTNAAALLACPSGS